MTREEILKLEPSLELDRLIAERVMGWKEGYEFVCDDWGALYYVNFGLTNRPWSPSTDIAAALEALLHVMETCGYDVMIESVSYGETDIGAGGIAWMVVLDPFDRERGQVKGESSHSLPLAICCALLAAMEVANED